MGSYLTSTLITWALHEISAATFANDITVDVSEGVDPSKAYAGKCYAAIYGGYGSAHIETECLGGAGELCCKFFAIPVFTY